MIKKLMYITISIAMLSLWTSCRKDFETVPSSGNLVFSKDTIYLDTVFSNIGSSTYNLKVYNRSKDDIHIPTVRLNQGENSYYRLNIDGIPGKTFENIEIPARDSIFIFVETTVDINDLSATALEFLYEDTIEFDTGNNQQNVELVTLIKDAVFLFPERFPDGTTETLNLGNDSDGNPILIEGFFLDNTELNWTDEKPYVIYGYAAISPTHELVIQPGARIHFHANSGLIASNNATLTVNGALSTDPDLLENEVIFEGDRLEPAFADVPGQWGTIWLTSGSTQHNINYATIKNATIGIIMDNNDGLASPTLQLNNTQIYNSSNIGLRARTATIDAENLVINNSGINSLSVELGGTYNFTHCTLANYWNNSFRGNNPSVYISDGINIQGVPPVMLNANFTNCIIYGNENFEFFADPFDMANLQFKITNSLIRFNDFNGTFSNPTAFPQYNFADTNFYEGVVRNADPNFRDANANDLIIGEVSAARGLDNISVIPPVTEDILGVTRTSPFDAGAYQHIIFN